MGEASQRWRRAQERRRRRLERRRERILEAAAEVFAERGYAASTIREIADAADVAEGTLYNYFGGKRDILLAIISVADVHMDVDVGEVDERGDRRVLISMIEGWLAFSQSDLPFARTLLGEAWVDDEILDDFLFELLDRVHRQLAEYIEARIQAGVFRPIDPQMGARLLMSMFGGLIMPVLRGVLPPLSPGERHEMAETMVDLFLEGMAVGPAVEEG
ncbi:MAG: TetR/AcrR family transcriptional regulator [Anaerolineae bacterium]